MQTDPRRVLKCLVLRPGGVWDTFSVPSNLVCGPDRKHNYATRNMATFGCARGTRIPGIFGSRVSPGHSETQVPVIPGPALLKDICYLFRGPGPPGRGPRGGFGRSLISLRGSTGFGAGSGPDPGGKYIGVYIYIFKFYGSYNSLKRSWAGSVQNEGEQLRPCMVPHKAWPPLCGPPCDHLLLCDSLCVPITDDQSAVFIFSFCLQGGSPPTDIYC